MTTIDVRETPRTGDRQEVTVGEELETLRAYMNRTCCGTSVTPGTVFVIGAAGAVAGEVKKVAREAL